MISVTPCHTHHHTMTESQTPPALNATQTEACLALRAQFSRGAVCLDTRCAGAKKDTAPVRPGGRKAQEARPHGLHPSGPPAVQPGGGASRSQPIMQGREWPVGSSLFLVSFTCASVSSAHQSVFLIDHAHLSNSMPLPVNVGLFPGW